MNYSLIVASISLFLATFVAAHDHDMPKFCTSNTTKCDLAGTNFTCVAATKDGCAMDVANGTADLALLSANDLVKNAKNLTIVYGQKLKGLDDNFVQYYGLAVVRKGTNFDLTKLKGVNSCHTGAGRTVGWKIPIGYLLFTKEMKFTDNQWKSASDFFNQSCVPGIRDRNTTAAVKDDLCSLCYGGNCTGDGEYAGYEGAFKCMAEGSKDRVGFVKETTAGIVLASGNYGSKTDYELLCKDGTKKALDDFKTCNIDKRPASALVTKVGASDTTIKEYQSLLDAVNITSLQKGGLVSSNAEKLVEFSDTVENYVGSYGDHYNALNGPKPTVKPSVKPTVTLTVTPTMTPTTKTTKKPTGKAQSIAASFALLVSAIFALLFLA